MRLQLRIQVVLDETVRLVLTRRGSHVFVGIFRKDRATTCIELQLTAAHSYTFVIEGLFLGQVRVISATLVL